MRRKTRRIFFDEKKYMTTVSTYLLYIEKKPFFSSSFPTHIYSWEKIDFPYRKRVSPGVGTSLKAIVFHNLEDCKSRKLLGVGGRPLRMFLVITQIMKGIYIFDSLLTIAIDRVVLLKSCSGFLRKKRKK